MLYICSAVERRLEGLRRARGLRGLRDRETTETEGLRDQVTERPRDRAKSRTAVDSVFPLVSRSHGLKKIATTRSLGQQSIASSLWSHGPFGPMVSKKQY